MIHHPGMAMNDQPQTDVLEPQPHLPTTGSLQLLDLSYPWRVIPAGPHNWTAQVRCCFWPCQIAPSEIPNCPSREKAIAAAEHAIRRHDRAVHSRPTKPALRWTR
jgi:hypothetical protein